MKYLSVCSGIEAATTAWHSLGWTPVAFSEVEPFPSAVLAHHWPEVPNLGDMTKYEHWNIKPDSVDLLVGGTPCQSFSVAGLRKGLRDPRGGLMLTYLEIAQRLRPRWVVWENVPGVLSSNGGRDFGSFLGALGELGYGWAYRVLDAQWFGVAQRRRRVFVVGCLGDAASAAAVLFESESVRRDSPPSREKREGTAGRFKTSSGKSSSVAPFGTTQITSAANYSNPKPGDPCHSMAAGAHPPAAAFAIQAGAIKENPDIGPDGIGVRADGVSYTLEARAEVQAVAFGISESADVGHCLRSGASKADKHESTTYVVNTAIRRLTPRECERLQGFPDNHTLIPWRGRAADQCPDSPRYKVLGNSMAVPVMRWIGERIHKAHIDSIL